MYGYSITDQASVGSPKPFDEATVPITALADAKDCTLISVPSGSVP